ncbi:MAG TPA: DUF3857 domain-containing protein, partial [Candidatus Limnocylindria bacterium]|nr:DUF3857 domain-containing protein [Candidatus Limnocylindria bacterium]
MPVDADGSASSDSEPQLLARACVSIGPVPDWVRPFSLDMGFTSKGSEHLSELLNSLQVHAELNQHSRHAARRLETAQAVQENSQWSLEFEPRTQRIVFHFFRVRRGEVEIDQLKLANARVIQREQGLERFTIDGCFTWLLVLEDIRVRDVLEWSYTVEHNPTLLPGICRCGFAMPDLVSVA